MAKAEDNVTTQTEENIEREKLLKFLEIREQEIIQAEQVQEQLALPEKFSQL